MLRYLTAGESHGPQLTGIIEGLPAGLIVSEEDINKELARRQIGYGRGQRMKIEKDKVKIFSGVRHSETLGSPIALSIENRDWKNWTSLMSIEGQNSDESKTITRPRPGHADLSGVLKYNRDDIRDILERASARETAMRVAIGALCKKLIKEIDIEVISHVVRIGDVKVNLRKKDVNWIRELAEKSDLRCADEKAEPRMKKWIDSAKESGYTLGGIFEIIICNPCVGLGSHVQWDRKLDANLARALMSIQAIKGVEVGAGFRVAGLAGFVAHDEIGYNGKSKGRAGFYRTSNKAGGIEGGMSNGEDIILRAAMKPIPTLVSPLKSVDLKTKQPVEATVERSDVCAVPAAAVVGEAVVAFEIAQAVLEKFGGDSIGELKRNYYAFLEASNE
ncbi:MAG: chorismate synthase [bacterium]